MNWMYEMYCYLWVANRICGSLYDEYKKDSCMWGVVPILTLQLLSCWLLITFVSSKLGWHCLFGNEPEVLLVLYTGIFKCATAGIRMQSLFYFLSVYWVFFFSISVSCNLIGLFLCLTVGLIQQLQALKCSQQTTEKKNRQEISWQYRQRTPSGKKISSGDGRGFDLTIPKDKLEFRGRTEVSRM